jgi:hypothetical protein
MTARRVRKLLAEYRAHGESLFRLMPDVYANDRPTTDSIGRSWQLAADASVEAYAMLAELSMLLDHKAGYQRQGPVEAVPPRIYAVHDVIEIDGDEATLAEWCQRFDKTSDVVLQRLADGMDVEEAIVTPLGVPFTAPAEAACENG